MTDEQFDEFMKEVKEIKLLLMLQSPVLIYRQELLYEIIPHYNDFENKLSNELCKYAEEFLNE